MSEWFKEPVLKPVTRKSRGFESHLSATYFLKVSQERLP